MLFDAEEYFLVKKAHDGCHKSILKYYYLYTERKSPSVAMAEDAARNIKIFLNSHNPYECIKYISSFKNEDDINNLKHEYIFLLTHLSATCIDYGYYEEGTLWAKKSLDMIDFLFDGMDKAEREQIKSELYSSTMLAECAEYFDSEYYEDFKMDWERDSFKKLSLVNDNLNH